MLGRRRVIRTGTPLPSPHHIRRLVVASAFATSITSSDQRERTIGSARPQRTGHARPIREVVTRHAHRPQFTSVCPPLFVFVLGTSLFGTLIWAVGIDYSPPDSSTSKWVADINTHALAVDYQFHISPFPTFCDLPLTNEFSHRSVSSDAVNRVFGSVFSRRRRAVALDQGGVPFAAERVACPGQQDG